MSDLQNRNFTAMKQALEKFAAQQHEFNARIETLHNRIGQQDLEIAELKKWKQMEAIKNYSGGSTT